MQASQAEKPELGRGLVVKAHKHQDNWGPELQSLSDLGQVPSPLRASVSPAVKLELCSSLSGSQPVGLDSWGPVFMAINYICTVAKPISLTSAPAPDCGQETCVNCQSNSPSSRCAYSIDTSVQISGVGGLSR